MPSPVTLFLHTAYTSHAEIKISNSNSNHSDYSIMCQVVGCTVQCGLGGTAIQPTLHCMKRSTWGKNSDMQEGYCTTSTVMCVYIYIYVYALTFAGLNFRSFHGSAAIRESFTHKKLDQSGNKSALVRGFHHKMHKWQRFARVTWYAAKNL